MIKCDVIKQSKEKCEASGEPYSAPPYPILARRGMGGAGGRGGDVIHLQLRIYNLGLGTRLPFPLSPPPPPPPLPPRHSSKPPPIAPLFLDPPLVVESRAAHMQVFKSLAHPFTFTKSKRPSSNVLDLRQSAFLLSYLLIIATLLLNQRYVVCPTYM